MINSRLSKIIITKWGNGRAQRRDPYKFSTAQPPSNFFRMAHLLYTTVKPSLERKDITVIVASKNCLRVEEQLRLMTKCDGYIIVFIFPFFTLCPEHATSLGLLRETEVYNYGCMCYCWSLLLNVFAYYTSFRL